MLGNKDLMDCDLLDVLEHWSPSDRALYKKEWIAQIVSYYYSPRNNNSSFTLIFWARRQPESPLSTTPDFCIATSSPKTF
jgi:hypothetical protein